MPSPPPPTMPESTDDGASFSPAAAAGILLGALLLPALLGGACYLVLLQPQQAMWREYDTKWQLPVATSSRSSFRGGSVYSSGTSSRLQQVGIDRV